MPLMFDFTKILASIDIGPIVVYTLGIIGFWALIVILILLLLKGGK